MRYLAIDYGRKHIGLAISDAGGAIAFPHSVFDAGADPISQIMRVVRNECIETIVIGLPLNMDGTEGYQAGAVRKFAERLSGRISLPMVFFDERLSSAEADWKLADMELNRGGKRKRQDALAAAAFLQTFLDEKKLIESGPEIICLDTPELVAQKALDVFCISARQAIEQKGVFFCVISGGNSPKEFFRLLAADAILNWAKIHIFWADERCVSPEHPDSNFKLAKNTFLSALPIPQENIHRIEAELPDSQKASDRYEQIIRNVFAISSEQIPEFDLVVLGLGMDGHTASLLPGMKTVLVENHLAAAVSSTAVLHPRITLTVPVLLAARKLMFLIIGEQKAQITRTVLTQSHDLQRWPVHSLWSARHKMIWLLDTRAASLLPAFSR